MRFRLSPAGVIAVIALVLALGGSAIAAGVFTAKEKKQIEKIAVQAFDERIGEASVKHAASADTATEATTAGRASTADKATEATTALRATEADSATRATEADRATEATRAVTAGDAEKLGGQPATSYQRALQGGCAPGSAIATITPQGQVTCSGQAVQAIRLVPRMPGSALVRLANGVTVAVLCTPNPTLEIHNNTLGQINLNYSELKPGSTKVAGEIIVRDERHSVNFAPRMDAQYTFLSPQGVTTVNLHAFDGDDFCEISGTAVTAFG